MKNRIFEIDIIRCIVIILLVLYHSFAPYCGGWDPITDVNCNIPGYFWIAKLFYCGLLETFVMISGYIFSFSLQKYDFNWKNVLSKKIKRLYFPAIIWGSIFMVIMGNFSFFLKPMFPITLLNGVAHLWFLPMLFWCFVFEIFIGRHISQKYFILFMPISAVTLPSVPILKISLYYCFFFHLGIIIAKNKKSILDFVSRSKILILLFIFCVVFVVFTYCQSKFLNVDSSVPIFRKFFLIYIRNIMRLISSSLVLLFFFYIGTHIKLSSKLRQVVMLLSTLSFGIYIFQEMILRVLYYKVNLFSNVNELFVPWIAFMVTIVLSTLISLLFSRNKFLKYLLS